MTIRTSPRGKRPFRANTRECDMLQDLLSSIIVAVSEYYVCGTPVRSNVRKDVQTVPRRIKLSRAGMPFSKPLPQLLRPSLMGSELFCQNFDLVKFREIIPRNPCYGTFFSQNFESEFSKNSDPPAEPKLESTFWPNPDPSSGLDNFVRTSPRGSCAAF